MDSKSPAVPFHEQVVDLASQCHQNLKTLINSLRTLNDPREELKDQPLLMEYRDRSDQFGVLVHTLKSHREDLSNKCCGASLRATLMLDTLKKLDAWLVVEYNTAASNQSDYQSDEDVNVVHRNSQTESSDADAWSDTESPNGDMSTGRIQTFFITRSIQMLNQTLRDLLAEVENANKLETIRSRQKLSKEAVHDIIVRSCPTAKNYLVPRLVNTCYMSFDSRNQEYVIPFVCTFESCSKSSELYSDREVWYTHECKYHRFGFGCPLGGTTIHCREIFSSSDEMISHAETYRGSSAVDHEKEAWTRRCGQSELLVCQICGKLERKEDLIHHISAHFKSIEEVLQMEFATQSSQKNNK